MKKQKTQFSKGYIPWNKGKKGIQVAWNKGLKMSKNAIENNRKSHLGQKSWNKGTKGIMKPNKTSFKKRQIPHNKGIMLSEKFPSIHYWIKSIKGQPRKCEICGTTKARAYHWSNKDHKYSKNPNDYQRLCVSCHMKYDYKFNNRNKSNGN